MGTSITPPPSAFTGTTTAPAPTAHSVEKYLPKKERTGVALCLSGGGFRATLFHLGALRRLNELGVLQRIDAVTSVSGGSIMSATLATALQWPLSAPVPGDRWEALVRRPIREFTRKNRRNGPIFSRLIPTNWTKADAAVTALAKVYEAELTRAKLVELPDRPRFVFCATDMAFGVNFVFEKSRMGDYLAGYVSPPPADWPIARAVAASSCFPPIFNPLKVGLSPSRFAGGKFPAGKQRDECVSDLRLTDGGNYDNMGLEPVWKDFKAVLVSDGGGTFDFKPDGGLGDRLMRYTSIIDNQSRALRKRWLMSSFIEKALEGTYWGISSSPSAYNAAQGYSAELADTVIAEIRTDLDDFSDAEAAVLENHGYLLTDAAIKRYVPALPANGVAPLNIPHPDWMDEARVRMALRESGKRKIL